MYIEENCNLWLVVVMCDVLEVSRSGYYAWRGRPPSKRAQEDAALWLEIEKAHDASHQIYGYRRVHALLRAEGWQVSHSRVLRIWRLEGLKVPPKQPKRSRLWLADGSCIRLAPTHRQLYELASEN